MVHGSIAAVRTFACVVALNTLLAGCNGEDSSPSNPTADSPPVSDQPVTSPLDEDPPPAATPPVANVQPQILGTPAGTVLVGQAYDFKPSASDANGDALMFSISSQPRWASFDSATGHLWGTPGPGDVGSYEQIAISVSDGQATRGLPQFAIAVVAQATGSVTLAWQPPTQNTDGTPLTSLGGYKIHYGTQSGVYDRVISIGAGVTRYVIENLTPGTYFFALTAVSGTGAESDLSGEASKTIS